MNSQTHLLLACALLARRGDKVRNAAVVTGSILPDLPVYGLYAVASAQGFNSQEVFGDLYFREEMRNLMGLVNSFFVALAIAVAGWLFRDRWWGWALLFFAAAMALHAIGDLPVHVDDGHRHFWPFSTWVFNSPLSYWDREHHGGMVSLLEMSLGIICAIVVWVRFPVTWIRVLCAGAIAAYIAVPAYWMWTFA